METDWQDRGSDGRMRGRLQGLNANSLLAETLTASLHLISYSYSLYSIFLPPFPLTLLYFGVTNFSFFLCLLFPFINSLPHPSNSYHPLSTSFPITPHCFSCFPLSLSRNKHVSRDQRGNNVSKSFASCCCLRWYLALQCLCVYNSFFCVW